MRKQGLNENGEETRSMYVEHEPVDFVCADDGMTRQEFAAECDINTILAQYEKTGVINHVSRRQGEYMDLTEAPPDLMSALAFMDTADEAFMRLPAAVRKEFDNDPLKFVEFAQDPKNLDQMRAWDLAPKPPEPPVAPPAPLAPGGEPGASPTP